MTRFLLINLLVMTLCLPTGLAFAHGNKHKGEPLVDGEVSYTEEVDGVKAVFIVEQITKIQRQGKVLFECDIKARLSGADGAPGLNLADVAMRYTSGHEKFGQVYALIPDPDDQSYRKKVFLHEDGMQHFLLIVIDQTGSKREFHFHHSF